jgi:hypothetical protein
MVIGGSIRVRGVMGCDQKRFTLVIIEPSASDQRSCSLDQGYGLFKFGKGLLCQVHQNSDLLLLIKDRVTSSLAKDY